MQKEHKMESIRRYALRKIEEKDEKVYKIIQLYEEMLVVIYILLIWIIEDLNE